jgi:hypothetical protein
MQLPDGREVSELTIDLPEEVTAALLVHDFSDHPVVAAVIRRGAHTYAVRGQGRVPWEFAGSLSILSEAFVAKVRGGCRGPGTGSGSMTQYLISFGAHAMDHIPDSDMPAVADAAHAVCQEAINAGVFVCAGGLENQPASMVAAGGTVTDGPYPDAIGGITVVDVPSRDEALKWAAKTAAACRCAIEVREIGFDPELDAMLGEADSRR